jgi:hypothetical protein
VTFVDGSGELGGVSDSECKDRSHRLGLLPPDCSGLALAIFSEGVGRTRVLRVLDEDLLNPSGSAATRAWWYPATVPKIVLQV